MSLVTVLGAGVAGLTTAVRLLESGHDVAVIAAAHGPATTSARSAGLWFPFLTPGIDLDRFVRRAAATRRRIEATIAEHPSIRPITIWELREDASDTAPPEWARRMALAGSNVETARLPAGFGAAWAIETYTIAPATFLAELAGRLERPTLTRRVSSLPDLLQLTPDADAIVNCSGLGARELCADTSLTPSRGVCVLIGNDRGAPLAEGRVWHGPQRATYALPRNDGMLIGTTIEPGREAEPPTPDEVAQIRTRAQALIAGTSDITLDGGAATAGARPMRRDVRLESDTLDGRLLIHNYGHGPAGITLCWGCADEVAAIVDRTVSNEDAPR
jgi:D-amino-acid oxidase